MDNEGTTSNVRSEALSALSESSRRSRRQSSTTEPPAEQPASSTTETPEQPPAPKSRRSTGKPQEYVAQYPIKTKRDNSFVILKPGDPLTPEEMSDEASLTKLMASGVIVTKPVWDAKVAALQAEKDAKDAAAEYEEILDDQAGIG